jgi:hypothetical protein|tara:strand:- start:1545 stop:1862 length:318 start_codon:yes stop_codon:yes gene_type:complete
MPRWAWLLALAAVILTAFFVPRASAEPLCFVADAVDVIHPPADRVGFGVSNESVIMISITSDRGFVITVSPPVDPPIICVIVMGEAWEFIRQDERQPDAQPISVR